MSYFLKLLLSMLLIPVFLILLLLAIPILMLITAVTSRTPRHVRVKTFTTSWPPEQTENSDSSAGESVYDVECTVISSTPLGENQTSSKPLASSPGEASANPGSRDRPDEEKV